MKKTTRSAAARGINAKCRGIVGGILRNDNAISHNGKSFSKLSWDEIMERDHGKPKSN